MNVVKACYIRARRAGRRTARVVGLLAAKAGRWRVECPICGWRFRAFRPHGSRPRPNSRCPRCGALERHRLLYLYLRDRMGVFEGGMRMLHFAPEPWFVERFAEAPRLEYLTADLDSPIADVHMDVTALPVADESVDLILCSHVLEHVPDDRAAMAEFLRVLRPSGRTVLQVPMNRRRRATIEDPTITDPAERERRFGQYDHVRAYGRDFADRLRGVGFEVDADWYVRRLDVERYGLREEPVYVGRKPA